METKLLKSVLLIFVFSGISLMGVSAPAKKVQNMRSETCRECRCLTGACSQKELNKVRKSNEYIKLRKLVRTRHW